MAATFYATTTNTDVPLWESRVDHSTTIRRATGSELLAELQSGWANNKNPQRTSIAQLGEFGLIDHLTKNFEITQASTLKGIGDDAAILDFKDKKVVVSTDLLIEGVHFDLAYMPLKHLGYKAVVVNISDICAMNAKPTQITVSVAVSNRFPLEALEELFAFMAQISEMLTTTAL